MRSGIRLGLLTLLVAAATIPRGAAAVAPLTAEEAARRVAEAPRAKAGEDALVLFDGLWVSWRDGRAEARHQRLVRIDTEWAMDTLGDPRLPWDRSRQQLLVHASRTYLLGGGTIDTPDNGFNEVTPDGVARSVDHLDLREMVVTRVGLEPGVSVFLDWTVQDTVATEEPYDLVVFPHDRFPILERVVEVAGLRGELVTPAGSLLRVPGPRPAGEKTAWSAEDLPAAPSPPGDRAGDELPWLAFSSAASWQEAVAGVVRELDAAAEARDGVADALAELDGEKPFLNEREALAAWAGGLTERTGLLHGREWSGFGPPRSAERTLSTSFATPLERCALMLAGCRERDLETSVVFPGRWRSTTTQVPALGALLPPVLRVVDRAGDAWWVDPVAGSVTSRAPFAPRTPCFGGDATGIILTRTPEDTSRVDISGFWDPSDGRARCEGPLSGPGAATLGLDEPQTLIEKWLAGWTDSTEVEEVRVTESGPERIRFSAVAKVPLPEEDERGRVAVALPVAPLAMESLLPHADAARSGSEHVLFSEAPAEVGVRWQLRIPEGRALLAPGDVGAECPGGLLEIHRSVDGATVEIDYALAWDGRPVPPSEYAPFRRLLLEVTDARNTGLVLGARADSTGR